MLTLKIIFTYLFYSYLLFFSMAPTFADTSCNIFSQLANESGGSGVCLDKGDISCFVGNIIKGTIQPTITAVTPLGIPRDSTLDLLINGIKTNFTSASSVTVADLTVNKTTTLSPTQIVANVTVPASVVTGMHDVLVSTNTESARGGCLEITERVATPQLLSISPTQVKAGFKGTATLYGTNTHFTPESKVNLGAGITATVTEVISPTQLQISMEVATTATGFHDLQVTTDSEIAKDNQIAGPLLVTSFSGLPSITTVEPASGQQGTPITLTISATNTHFLASTSEVAFSGEGITVKSVTVQNETTLQATLDIAENATPNFRDIFVKTASEIASGLNLFSVAPCNTSPCSPQPSLHLSASKVAEQSPSGTVIGTFSTTPVGEYRYELQENSEGRFKIVGSELQVADGSLLKTGNYSIQVGATNADLSLNEVFTIVVATVNQPPSNDDPLLKPGPDDTGNPDDTDNEPGPDDEIQDQQDQPVTSGIDENSNGTGTPLPGTPEPEELTLPVIPDLTTPISAPENQSDSTPENPIPPPTSDEPPEDIPIDDEPAPPVEIVSPQPNGEVESPSNENESAYGNPATTPGSEVTVPSCVPNQTLALRPAKQQVTLTTFQDPLTLTFTGGQGEIKISQQPDPAVVSESLDFPEAGKIQLTLTPTSQGGNTHLTLKDCAGSRAEIEVAVKKPTPLQPATQKITLSEKDPLITLSFTGDCQAKLVQPPDLQIVTVEETSFSPERGTQVKLAARQSGTTQFTLEDCAGNRAETQVQVMFREPVPLQPETQDITLFEKEPPITLLFTGECQAKLAQAPDPKKITLTLEEHSFPPQGGAQIKLVAREAGDSKPLIITDTCGHQATVNFSIKPFSLCSEDETMSQSQTMDIILVEDEAPVTQWFSGGYTNRRLAQAPDGQVVALEAVTFPELGGISLTFVPRSAGETQLKLKTGDCSEATANVKVFKPRTLNHLCWLDQKMDGTCSDTSNPLRVLAPNALAINRKGDYVETTTYFSTAQLDTNNGALSLFSAIDESHVGQSANLLLVADIEEDDEIPYDLMYDGKMWYSWDGNFAHLTVTKVYEQLPHLLEINEIIPLENLKGFTTIYIGYQLENGDIVFNGQNPLLFKGGSALRVLPQGEMTHSSARFDGFLSTLSHPQPSVDLTASPTETVTLAMTITVEKEHVGQAASIILVLARWHNDEVDFLNYAGADEKGRWYSWDGKELGNLKALHSVDKLSESFQFQKPFSLKEVPAEMLNGEFTVYVGYRLGNGVVIFSGLEPLQFRISGD